MNTLTQLLALENGGVAAFVGCGGKTATINLLAVQNAGKKILAAPTTKMYPPKGAALCDTLEKCRMHAPQPGVQAMGTLNPDTGKLEALPLDFLQSAVNGYDLSLLEADGSNALPCKGWRENEPVVPDFCTHTVGIASIGVLGKPALADTVFRLPLFLELTGLQEGAIITIEALADMICASGGMFKNAVGKRFLVVNQAEGETGEQNARALLAYIREHWSGMFAGMLYGSARNDTWQMF